MDKNPDLVAPCGMNCGICGAYLARKHNLKEQGIRMPYCTGCRPRDKRCAYLRKWCRLLAGGTVKFCHECPDFPCARLKTIDKRYRERYRMSMIGNLEFIRANGIDAFLEKEEEKWMCRNCGGTICCHNGICFDCEGDKLKTKRDLHLWEDRPEPRE